LDRLKFIEDLARANFESGHYKEALKQYKILDRHLPENRTNLKFNMASSNIGMGRYDRGIKMLKELSKSGYRSEALYNQWGLALELKGKDNAAGVKYVEGKIWADENAVQLSILNKNFERLNRARPPEPLKEWLASPETELEIPFWMNIGDTFGIKGDTMETVER
ncbi:MAG: hypothetical protein ABEJ65_08825, partial [bacterium]